MKKKLISFLVLGAMTASLITGCGAKPTAKDILNKMSSSIEETNSFQANTKLNLALKLNINTNLSSDIENTEDDSLTSISTPIKVGFDMKSSYVKKSKNNFISKYDGKFNALISDQTYDQDFKFYMQNKGNTSTQYIYIPTYDTWTKTSNDADETSPKDTIDFIVNLADHFTLDKKIQQVNKTDCYVLKGSFKGTDLKKIYKELLSDFASDSMDSDTLKDFQDIPTQALKNIALDTTVYIDKKSYRPIKCTYDFKKTNLNKILKAEADSNDTISEGIESMGLDVDDISFDTNKFFISTNYSNYNKVKSIKIPKEALKASSYDDSYEDESFDTDSYDDESTETSDDTDTQYQSLIKELDSTYPKDYDKNIFSIEPYTISKDEVAYKITNISNQTVSAEGLIRYLDEKGNVNDCMSVSTDSIAAGKSVLVHAVTDCKFDSTSLGLEGSSSDYLSDPLDVSWNEKSINDDSIVLNLQNNADQEANCSVTLLLKKGDSPVGIASKYIDTMEAGQSQDISIQTDYYEDFDNYEVYLKGSSYTSYK